MSVRPPCVLIAPTACYSIRAIKLKEKWQQLDILLQQFVMVFYIVDHVVMQMLNALMAQKLARWWCQSAAAAAAIFAFLSSSCPWSIVRCRCHACRLLFYDEDGRKKEIWLRKKLWQHNEAAVLHLNNYPFFGGKAAVFTHVSCSKLSPAYKISRSRTAEPLTLALNSTQWELETMKTSLGQQFRWAFYTIWPAFSACLVYKRSVRTRISWCCRLTYAA